MMTRAWILFTVLLSNLLGLPASSALLGQGQVQIRQPNMVAVKVEQADRSVFNGVLRIGDVAVVEAENNFLSQRVRALDLEVLTMEQPRTVITRQQLEYRLLLAGVKPEQIALTGFEKISIELQDARQVIELLANTLTEQCDRKYGMPRGFCQVSLQADARKLIESSPLNWRDIEVTAILPAELQAGEQLLPVEFYSGSVVTTLQLPVHFRFNHQNAPAIRSAVPAAAATLPQDGMKSSAQLIPATSVFAEHPTVLRNAASSAANGVTAIPSTQSSGVANSTSVFSPTVAKASYEVTQTAGKEVLRMAPAVEVPVAAPAVLVARGAAVRVTQRVGQVMIGLKTARAAQDGKLGDVIEVIAPYKGRDGREVRLLGRVIAENELELVR
jgi:hypothetical protein